MSENPLSKLYRTKSIFISLPSNGRFYPKGISLSIDGELGVMPMTARDEIAIKAPDALFNGDALINLIKSCAPDIVNPEEMPACDVDPVVLAIRAASKKTIESEITCPSCKEENTYEINLLGIISTSQPIDTETHITIGEAKIHVRPYSLRSQLKANMQKFHHSRMEMVLEHNGEITDEKKIEIFNSAFAEATKLTVELIVDNIDAVELPEVTVTDKSHIRGWVENIDKDTYKLVVDKIKSISDNKMTNTMKVACPNCNHQYDTLIELNPVNFFI